MRKLSGTATLALLAATLVVVASCGSASGDQSTGTSSSADGTVTTSEGGESDSSDSSPDTTQEVSESSSETAGIEKPLEIGYSSEPATLDTQVTTSTPTHDIGRMIYESLLVLDGDERPVPQLAANFTIDDDLLGASFEIRDDVYFHNGNIMTPADVVASMTRWCEIAAPCSSTLASPTWDTIGESTVRLTIEKPSANIALALADSFQMAAVMPADIVTDAPATGVTEFIGTGPYKLTSWDKGSRIQFERFDDYYAKDGIVSGMSGGWKSTIREINWNFVTDASALVTGLLAGQFDLVPSIPYDSVKQLNDSPNHSVQSWEHGGEVLYFNKATGVFSNELMRQAANLAINKNEVMTAAFGQEEYYSLDCNIFPPSSTWYIDEPCEAYDNYSPDRAKELIAEAGYNGEEVVLLASKEHMQHYNASIVTHQALNDVGINVKLEVYDWATVVDKRGAKEGWGLMFSGGGFRVLPKDPSYLYSTKNYFGWTNSPVIDSLIDQMEVTADEAESKELMRQLRDEIWNYLPVIYMGQDLRFDAYSNKLDGYYIFQNGPVVFNAYWTE